MAINFPDSPSVNDTHTIGDKTWTWDGTAWNVVVGGVPTSISELSISNDLTVDTGTLHVDSTNDRVGIGTTSPTGMLHVSGSDPKIWLTDTDTNADSYVSASSSVGSLILSADENNEVGSSQIAFKVDGSDKMVIQSTGNVGIGTTSPAEELDVVGDVQVSGRLGIGSGISAELDIKGASNPEIRLQSTDSTDPFLYFGDQVDAVRGGIGYDTSADALLLRGYNNSTRMTIDSSGKVGINDTTPSYTLDVNGDINTTGALRTDGKKTGLVLLTSGDVSSGGPITFTSLFSSEFDNYVVYISELTCTGQNAIYYRTASGGSWNTSSVYSNQRIYGQTTSIGAQRFSSTYAQIGYAGGRESNYEIIFFSPYLSTQTAVISRGAYSDNTNAGFIEFHHSYVDNTTSYDGFVFDEVTGSASISCRYEVYGMPK